MFVVVRKVVEEVERKVLLNFGGHWKSPELAASRRREKCFFFCRESVEEFNGMSFIIFGGVLDRFGNF